MVEEMIREGRTARNSIDPAIVEDPRDYLYVEVYNDPHSATIALDVTAADGKSYSSDFGFPSLRVNRPGFVRIAVYVPRDVNSEAINTIWVRSWS
ncbi:MAG: hypothetical protein ABI878_01950 [Acidobacteriota bacterium]